MLCCLTKARGKLMRSELRGLPLCIIALWLSAPPKAARAAELGLDDAVRLALEQNVEVRLARSEVEVATARQAGASLLLQNNPELSASAGQRSRRGDRTPDYTVSIAQPIEIAGQRASRMERATATFRSAEARLTVRRLAVVAEVRQAFARALAAQAELKVADEGVELAKQALNAAEERHRAGDASLIEVNTARIEVGRTSRERVAALQQVQLSMTGMRALLGLEGHENLRLRGGFERLSSAPIFGPEVLERARRQRADLLAARAELEAAEAELSLAERDAFPTPRIGASYSSEEGAQIVQGTLSLDLPLFNRNQEGKGVARERVSQTRLALEALERRVAQEVELALAGRLAAQAALDTVSGDVLRAAESNLELANEGYRAGQLDFLQLLLIRRSTLDARREHIQALEELTRAEAQLALVLGTVPTALEPTP